MSHARVRCDPWPRSGRLHLDRPCHGLKRRPSFCPSPISMAGWKTTMPPRCPSFADTCADIGWPRMAGALRAGRHRPRPPQLFFELFFSARADRRRACRALHRVFRARAWTGRAWRTGGATATRSTGPPPRRAMASGSAAARSKRGACSEGRGLEIAWVPMTRSSCFLLQIQGSGRIRLTDGFDDPRGLWRAERSALSLHRAGTRAPWRSTSRTRFRRRLIGNWVRRNPTAGRELALSQPVLHLFSARFGSRIRPLGPLGAIEPPRSRRSDHRGRPAATRRWARRSGVEKDGAGPMRRLMIAQDTGGAIRGSQRADIFFGFGGLHAGEAAGTIRDPGRMVVLLPIELAHQRVPDA